MADNPLNPFPQKRDGIQLRGDSLRSHLVREAHRELPPKSGRRKSKRICPLVFDKCIAVWLLYNHLAESIILLTS
ncbi:hypothetical protein VULLAG_LOCUS6722 [Vulpes lagopus]